MFFIWLSICLTAERLVSGQLSCVHQTKAFAIIIEAEVKQNTASIPSNQFPTLPVGIDLPFSVTRVICEHPLVIVGSCGQYG